MKECVYLIGCRAVGKSSIGAKLARRLGYSFLDSDSLITEKAGCSVAKIVARDGWKKFRELEEEVLLKLLERRSCVVATGGGAIVHRDLWPELKKRGVVVWLTADLKILKKRISADGQSESLRPSLTGESICRELEDVLAERTPLYAETADYTIDSGSLSVDEAVQQIENYLACCKKS